MPLLVAVRDLFFRSKIDEAARRLGVALQFAPRDRSIAEAFQALGPRALLLDLNAPGALDALRAARAAGVRAIGFLGHLQRDLAQAATDAGAEVLTRGQIAARLDALLREVTGPPVAARP
jgi:hypothetical protein